MIGSNRTRCRHQSHIKCILDRKRVLHPVKVLGAGSEKHTSITMCGTLLKRGSAASSMRDRLASSVRRPLSKGRVLLVACVIDWQAACVGLSQKGVGGAAVSCVVDWHATCVGKHWFALRLKLAVVKPAQRQRPLPLQPWGPGSPAFAAFAAFAACAAAAGARILQLNVCGAIVHTNKWPFLFWFPDLFFTQHIKVLRARHISNQDVWHHKTHLKSRFWAPNKKEGLHDNPTHLKTKIMCA